MRPADLRVRTAPEIVDAATVLVRRNVVPLLVISVLFTAPAGAIEYVRRHGGPHGLWFNWLQLPFISLADAALALGALDAYEGRVVQPSLVLGRVLRRAWPVIGSGIYRLVFVCLGLIVLVAPGLMLAATWALVPAIAVLEPQDGMMRALRRSGELCEGWRWHALASVGFPTLLVMVAAAVLGAAYQRLGFPLFLSGLGPTIAAMLLRPLLAALQVVLYFDLRIRKEGYDVEAMLAATAA